MATGADLIEVDVQMSADGVFFLRHNYRLGDGRQAHALRWDELHSIESSIAQLKDILSWAQAEDAFLTLDVKDGFSQSQSIFEALGNLLRRTDCLDRVCLAGWNHAPLAAMKKRYPKLATRVLIRARPTDLVSVIRSARADSVSLAYDLIRAEDVASLHDHGVAIVLGELWEPNFGFALEMGVDIVTWGDPAAAKLALNSL
jgi:glycerophosphoryl diester phosphodiesterase